MRCSLLICLAAFQLSAQEPARIAGRVIHAILGEPLEGAKITLGFSGPSTTTDSNGNFEFQQLKPDRYQINAEKEGFAHSPSQPLLILTLAAGENRSGLILRLSPASQLSGRVLNADGIPVDSSVTLISAENQAHAGFTRATKDGFKFEKLKAGSYRLYAQAWDIPKRRHGLTYFPSTLDPLKAEIITIGAGESRTNLDLKLQAAAWFTIKGRFLGKCPAPNTCKVVYSFLDNRIAGGVQTGHVREDGAFTLEVPAGNLRIHVQSLPSGPGRMQVLGHTGLNIPIGATNESIEEVIIRTNEPRSVRARFIWPQGFPSPDPQKLNLAFNPHGGLGVMEFANHAAENVYSVASISPDLYGIRANGLPPGTYVKQILAGPHDITQTGLDLTLGPPPDLTVVIASDAASLFVKVSSSTSIPNGQCLAVLLRDTSSRSERELYSTQSICNARGEFSISNLAPGTYSLRVQVDGKWTATRSLRLSSAQRLDVSVPAH